MICWPYIKLGSVLQVICSSSEYIDDMLALYQAGFSTTGNLLYNNMIYLCNANQHDKYFITKVCYTTISLCYFVLYF